MTASAPKSTALPPGWPPRKDASAPAARSATLTPTGTESPKLPVAVLGATGVVGQRFIERLQVHPFFVLKHLVANGTAGQTYGQATTWQPETPLQESVAGMRVLTMEEFEKDGAVACVFSALPSGIAGPIEARLAATGHKVFTNARDHRMGPSVPILVPEINADHLALVERQGGPGWIVANGNCTSIIFTMALAPLERAFGIEEAHVTSLQGISGAGYPGVSALDILDNVIPNVPGEEEKLEREPRKMLGTLKDGAVVDATFPIHATTTRVAVREGHTESVHVRLKKPATLESVTMAFRRFAGPGKLQKLPTSPTRPIQVRTEADRPQPRRDRDAGKGMTVSVGHIRIDASGHNVRFIVLGHNAIRGAAGQSIMNAELAFTEGRLG